MVVYRLPKELIFPDPCEADEDGLLAVGGDLSPERLLLAYQLGIFPWFSRRPFLWFSPDPRMVLVPKKIHVGKSLRNIINRNKFVISYDTEFKHVITKCAKTKRAGEKGTWITKDMIKAYTHLHKLGYAHSIEAWLDGDLVGGLYGVSLGLAFFGESMYADCGNASKVAFVHLVRTLESWGFHFVDCQVHTDHLQRFGAELWSREKYLQTLKKALEEPTYKGNWKIDATFVSDAFD